MKRINVKSSSILEIGYDIHEEILEVKFKRGAIYRYFKVRYEDVIALIFSESIGSYFSKNIAKNFKYEKVEEEYKND